MRAAQADLTAKTHRFSRGWSFTRVGSTPRSGRDQLPDVGKGSGLDHADFDRPFDNRVHQYPRVGDGSAARGRSHRRAGDRDRRCPGVGRGSAGHDGGSRRGPGDAIGSGTSRHNGTGSRGNRGKGRESSSDGRNGGNRSP